MTDTVTNDTIISNTPSDKSLVLSRIADCIRRSTERLGEHVCPICGKLFYPPDDEWAYRRAGNLICSWHCVCAYDRAEKAGRDRKLTHARQARASRKKGQISPRDREIVLARRSGESSASIAARYFLSADHVRRIVRRCADACDELR